VDDRDAAAPFFATTAAAAPPPPPPARPFSSERTERPLPSANATTADAPLLPPLRRVIGLEGSLTLSATASIEPSGTSAGHERRRRSVEVDDGGDKGKEVDEVDARIAKRGELASSAANRSHTAADSSTTSEDDTQVRVSSWWLV